MYLPVSIYTSARGLVGPYDVVFPLCACAAVLCGPSPRAPLGGEVPPLAPISGMIVAGMRLSGVFNSYIDRCRRCDSLERDFFPD